MYDIFGVFFAEMSSDGRDVVHYIRRRFVMSEKPLNPDELSLLLKDYVKCDDTLVAVCELMCELVEEQQMATLEQRRAQADVNVVLQCRSQLLTELMFAASLQHAQIVDDVVRRMQAEKYLRMRGMLSTYEGTIDIFKHCYKMVNIHGHMYGR